MFLSKIAVTDKRLMVDFYALHSMIYSLFPDEGKYVDRRQGAAILYRFERGRAPWALVQSSIPPFWGETKEFEPAYHQDCFYWFRLCANVAEKKTENRNRTGILDPERQIEWISRKAKLGGFDLQQANIIHSPGLQYAVRAGQMVTICPVTFEGVLRITDESLFLGALKYGIGSAKGFGCGLLSLAKA
jgi:CRISPR system Cascade subunit CasE